MASAVAVRRRQIGGDDVPAIVGLLTEGFTDRTRDYWERALEVLARRDAPEGYPRFGYMLEAGGEPVGVILLIYSRPLDLSAPVRCNLSSWYVREAFRGYATLLIAAAIGMKDVTYINSSPARYTWPILEFPGLCALRRGPVRRPAGAGFAQARGQGARGEGRRAGAEAARSPSCWRRMRRPGA